MTLDTFFEKFDLFADAPDAVGKMRELVLALAVQGKLVDQDTTDEPATKLLEQIKKQSRTAYQLVLPEDQPYQAPDSWLWVRLGFIAEIERGGSPRPIKDYITDDPDGLNWIKIGDTEKGGKYITSTQEKIRKDGLKKTRKVYPGDFLLTNSMSFGRPYITKIEGCIHDGWLRIHPPPQITSDYLYSLLSSSFVYAFFSKAAAGAVVQNLNADKVRELPIPLPPLAEQKRIVAKVDELMALCDRLEAQQQERETQHAALARASLSRFADAPTPANLHFLFHPSYAIPPADLRKSILTLAVQGKLVPQDSEDEAAEEVSIRVGEKQPQESEAPIEEAEQPWSLPSSWQWVRLGAIANIKHGYAFSSESFTSEPTRYVLTTPGNFYESGGFRDRGANTKYFKGEVPPSFVLNAGDLIIPMTEQAAGLLGSPAFIPDDGKAYLHNQRLGKLEFYSNDISPEFVFCFFNSGFFRGELARTCTGMKVRHTSPKRILKVPFPLPPLAEQRRIVAKVEQLMALVDALEQQLAASRATAAKLLTALVAELTTA